MSAVIPEESGLYLDSLGNVWRKWNDGIFVMLSDDQAQPVQYGPFVKLVTVKAAREALIAKKEELFPWYLTREAEDERKWEALDDVIDGAFPDLEKD